MSDVAEKRVHDAPAGSRTAVVVGAAGVVAVRVSAGDVGRFGLVDDRAARDAAAAPPGAGWPPVAVATADDVLVGAPDHGLSDDAHSGDAADARPGNADDARPEDAADARPGNADDAHSGDADGLAPAGFGPAVAVGFDGDALLAAGPDGRVARAAAPDEWPDGGVDDSSDSTPVDWTDLGTVGDVRAVDGPLVAAADGVRRVVGDDLTQAGLADVRDVAAAGPLAATGDGLYRLGNGWQDVLDGAFRFVTAEAGGRRRAHAGRARESGCDDTDGALWTRRDGEWTPVDLPPSVAGEAVVDVGYGAATYAVTKAGSLLAAGGGTVGGGVDDDDGAPGDGDETASMDWRAHPLGVRDVAALAVAGGGGRP